MKKTKEFISGFVLCTSLVLLPVMILFYLVWASEMMGWVQKSEHIETVWEGRVILEPATPTPEGDYI